MAEPSLRIVRDAPPDPHAGEDVHVPPMDLDAEASVISALLIDESYTRLIEVFLRPEHFYAEAHRRIYEGVIAVWRDTTKAKPCIVLVASWLKDRQRLEQVGGMAYITRVLDVAPVVANVEKYATIVYEKWRARQIIARCSEFAARGFLDYGDTQTYADRAAKAILDLARKSIRPKEETNAEMFAQIIGQLSKPIDDAQPSVETGLKLGIVAFDDLTHGVRPSEKVTIAAGTGAGKTAFALQAAVNVARQGIGVVFFEAEITRRELGMRMVCQAARIPSDRWRTRELSTEEWRRITAAQLELSRLPIRLIESHRFSVDDIRARTLVEVERMRVDHGVPLGLLGVDYVQRLAPSPTTMTKPRHEQIGHSTMGIKLLAQELKVGVLELAQRKKVEDKRSKNRRAPKPVEGDVGESKKIEDEADVVVFLWEPHARVSGDPRRHIKMVMTKQRGGPSDERDLIFQADQFRFEAPEFTTSSPPADRSHVDRGGYSDHQFAWGAIPED